jgi:hypothetical protein
MNLAGPKVFVITEFDCIVFYDNHFIWWLINGSRLIMYWCHNFCPTNISAICICPTRHVSYHNFSATYIYKMAFVLLWTD